MWHLKQFASLIFFLDYLTKCQILKLHKSVASVSIIVRTIGLQIAQLPMKYAERRLNVELQAFWHSLHVRVHDAIHVRIMLSVAFSGQNIATHCSPSHEVYSVYDA